MMNKVQYEWRKYDMNKYRFLSLILSIIVIITAFTSSCSTENGDEKAPVDQIVRTEDIYVKGYGITKNGDLKIVSAVKNGTAADELLLSVCPESKVQASLTSKNDDTKIISSSMLSSDSSETTYVAVYSVSDSDRRAFTEKLVVSPYVIADGKETYGKLSSTSVYNAASVGVYGEADTASLIQNIINVSERDEIYFGASATAATVSGFDSITYSESSQTYNYSSSMTIEPDAIVGDSFNHYTISYGTTQPVKGRISYTSPDGKKYTESFLLQNQTGGTFSSFTDFCEIGSDMSAQGASILEFENLGDDACSIYIPSVKLTQKAYPASDVLKVSSEKYKAELSTQNGAVTHFSATSVTKYDNLLDRYGMGSKYFGSGNYEIDKNKITGKLIDYTHDGNTATVTVRPYSDGVYMDSYVTTTVTAYNSCVTVENKICDYYDFGHEDSEYQYTTQVYANNALSELVYYNGTAPWTEGELYETSEALFDVDHEYEKENLERWAAFVDAENIGIGVFSYDADNLIASNRDGMSVMSFADNEFLPTYTEYAQTSVITASSLAEIRSAMTAQRNYGKTGTIIDENEGNSYQDYYTYIVTNDGERVPAVNNYLSGPMVGVDDLGRELPLASDTKLIREDRYVGLFYFLWLGEHDDVGVFDNTKILENNPDARMYESAWGPTNQMHFFSEPLYGYYKSSDEWVMRKHVEELTNAGVDFLYLDVTNGYPYINNAKKLMKILHEFNEQGWKAPQVVFYTNTNSSATVTQLYNTIYSLDYYPDTWLRINDKPVIVAYSADLSENINSYFEVREPQWPNESSQKTNAWPWISFFRKGWSDVYYNNEGEAEAISVSVAQHCGSVQFSKAAMYKDVFGETYDRGRSYHNGNYDYDDESYKYGYNFQETWNTALSYDVPYVLVTSWNEWVAQRQPSRQTWGDGYPVINFVDTFNIEYSRDIEMTRGYYFDNYYMQLISNIRKYKGTAPLLHQSIRGDDFITDIYDFNKVQVTYKDFSGDTADRNGGGFGNSTYTDTSGRNDITASKVAFDSNNVYFYVQCADNITSYTKNTTWMQLFVNSDNSNATGWYGYDYIVNYSNNGDGTVNVAKFNGESSTEYSFTVTSSVKCDVSGSKMMLTVPLSTLGISFTDVEFAFKWADSDTRINTMEQFYTDGDCAPLGRLNYLFVD